MIKKKIQAFLQSQCGVAAIEMAMIAPILALLFIGFVDFTGYISMSRKIALVASTTADLAGQFQEPVNRTDLEALNLVNSMIFNPMPSDGIRIEIWDYKSDGKTATRNWGPITNGLGTTCTPPNPAKEKFGDMMKDENDLVVAVACGYYHPVTGTFLGRDLLKNIKGAVGDGGSFKIGITHSMISRPRQQLTLNCTNCP